MFLLNLQSKESLNEQIKSQIISFVEVGVLKSGDRLPSVRDLAHANGINPNTVAKAYRELEEAGIIYTQPKKGAYVAGNAAAGRSEELTGIVEQLKSRGVSKTDLISTIEKVYGEE